MDDMNIVWRERVRAGAAAVAVSFTRNDTAAHLGANAYAFASVEDVLAGLSLAQLDDLIQHTFPEVWDLERYASAVAEAARGKLMGFLVIALESIPEGDLRKVLVGEKNKPKKPLYLSPVEIFCMTPLTYDTNNWPRIDEGLARLTVPEIKAIADNNKCKLRTTRKEDILMEVAALVR